MEIKDYYSSITWNNKTRTDKPKTKVSIILNHDVGDKVYFVTKSSTSEATLHKGTISTVYITEEGFEYGVEVRSEDNHTLLSYRISDEALYSDRQEAVKYLLEVID